MTNPKYYYNPDGDITDGVITFDTCEMLKNKFTDGEGYVWHGSDDLLDLLNNLTDEKERLEFQLKVCADDKLYSKRRLEKENCDLNKRLDMVETIVQDAIQDEKTAFGKMILKQLADKLGVDYD